MKWQSKLLRWYRLHKRDLPWRRTRDPYAIWVSEIMLQQTTVEAVIPYYERFLKRFPTAQVLAEAPEDEVLKLWSGLGYYSRARNLHKAAQIIARSGGASWMPYQRQRRVEGEAPAALPMEGATRAPTIEELMKLPGIGRYTAGAIASIAFGKRAAVVDGNVIRVLSRLLTIPDDPKSSYGQKKFWKKAEEILPRKHCGDFNQALMELGATLCSPENPACLLCPVAADCRARKKGRTDDFPKGRKKTVYRNVLMTAAVVQKDGRVLFVRRPAKGLLKGMWEVPMVEGDLSALLKKWPVEVVRRLPPVRHSVLNRRLTISPFLCRLRRLQTGHAGKKWIFPEEIQSLAMSSMNQKIVASLTLATPAGRPSDKDSRPTPSGRQPNPPFPDP